MSLICFPKSESLYVERVYSVLRAEYVEFGRHRVVQGSSMEPAHDYMHLWTGGLFIRKEQEATFSKLPVAGPRSTEMWFYSEVI